MNIYRISQTVNTGSHFNEYFDEAIVVAENEESARLMRPTGSGSNEFVQTRNLDDEKINKTDADSDAYIQEEEWVRNPKDVCVEYLGPMKNPDYDHQMVLATNYNFY